MKRAFAVGCLVLVNMLAFDLHRTCAEGRDRVARDAQGREISRMRSYPDGSSDRTQISYREGQAKTIIRERLNTQGQVTERVVERIDSVGRLAERKEATVDSSGRESGRRLSYSYDADGSRRVTTEIVK